LKSVPRTNYYDGKTWYTIQPSRSQNISAFYVPDDYPRFLRNHVYKSGAANLYSSDVIPYINIGTQYTDIIFRAGEDYLIGKILRAVGIQRYENNGQYIVMEIIQYLKPYKLPKNIIFVHNMKDLGLLSSVFFLYRDVYLTPFY
jgi:hypothetical protein